MVGVMMDMYVDEYASTAVIFANCITLALDSNRPGFIDTSMAQSLVVADFFFLGVFTVEMLMKMIAFGLFMLPGSYFRNGG